MLASWLYTVISFVCIFILGAIVVLLEGRQAGMAGWVTVPVLGILVGLCLGVTILRGGIHQRDIRQLGQHAHPVQLFGLGFALLCSLVVFGYMIFANMDFALGTFPLVMTGSVIACLFPRPVTLTIMTVLCLLPVLHFLYFPSSSSAFSIYLGVFIAFTIYMSMWAFNVVLKLDDARQTERDLAIARERLRFANELHDAQGHTLQVLALKTELAERLLDADIEAARAQLRDARQLAADALANTRSIARGYQQVSLEDELKNAVDVLEAAGTTCTLQIDEAPENGPAKELLARLVREGTTNLLRHATEATFASIEVTGASNTWIVRMRNNGAAPTTLASARATNGSGIAGLNAAFREANGEVESTLVGDEFTLTGRLPR
ncbi:Histidine kinase [Gulosibacter molinativorax]|nr:Histidine kinase [Gulosibacter molinativorax]